MSKPLTKKQVDELLKESATERAELDYQILRSRPDLFHQDCQPTFEKGAWACEKKRRFNAETEDDLIQPSLLMLSHLHVLLQNQIH